MTTRTTEHTPEDFTRSEGLRALLNRLHEGGPGAWQCDPEAADLMAYAAARSNTTTTPASTRKPARSPEIPKNTRGVEPHSSAPRACPSRASADPLESRAQATSLQLGRSLWQAA